MAVITLPSTVFFDKVDKLQLLRAGLALRSRYTGKRQTINFPFALWVFEGKLIPMDGADANDWRRFLIALEGVKNTFRLPVPGSPTPLSGYAANATIGTGGVAARATTAPIVGDGSVTILKAGDYFNIGDELKVAMADCVLTAGTGTVSFQPPTRKAYVATQAVTILNPFIYLALADAEGASWALERPVRHGIKLICMEAFD